MNARRTGAASAAALLGLATAAVAVDAIVRGSAREELGRHEIDAADLEAQRVRVIREGGLTARLATLVADGKLPLVRAVDELEPVHRGKTWFESAWPTDPPLTFRHGIARAVIARVDADLESDPQRRTAVLARLATEYSALR